MANFVEKLAELVSSRGISTVYGDPVTVDGVELVPVAISYFGFGGASSDSPDDEAGSGGGGGGASIPVGAYIGGPDGLRFQPNIISLIAIATPAIWVTGKSLALIIRALKK
ncbi:MAG: hypothetical protein RI885_2749 [Actinomycetota bacterium]